MKNHCNMEQRFHKHLLQGKNCKEEKQKWNEELRCGE